MKIDTPIIPFLSYNVSTSPNVLVPCDVSGQRNHYKMKDSTYDFCTLKINVSGVECYQTEKNRNGTQMAPRFT